MTEGTLDSFTDHSSLLPTADQWWDEESDDVAGNDLLRDEALKDLVGVPFKGLLAVYREGVQRKGVEYRDDYVSLELRVAPAIIVLRDLARIQTRRRSYEVPGLTNQQVGSLPGQQLVINDGSTGIYRQITEYLAAKELITLPDGAMQGEKGECIFDLPRSAWVTGSEAATSGIPIRLNCGRGLRFSEYSNEYLAPGETATTWYIA
jgi:hypothetical protein